MKFKKFLSVLAEETTSGDIASVDTKLDLVKRQDKHLAKGKRCKEHKLLNCEECDAKSIMTQLTNLNKRDSNEY